MPRRWYRRAWGSLHEPRTVTAVMVIAYTLVTLQASMILADDDPHDVAVLIAAGFMVAGGVVGVPAAWRGAWWLELGAAGAVMSGFIFLAALDLAAHPDILPGYSELRTALIALFFLSRALRIAPDMYAPGKGPNTPTREAQVRADTMVALADEAAREARERRAD